MVLCSHFEYPIRECVHSYSISACQPPFWNLSLAARTKQWIGLPRTYKKYVHTGTRCPLLCPNSRVGIHPHVLKESSAQVAPFLKYIFQKSLEPSKLPEDWRMATICPIYKKGDRSCPNNYRPVSVTSVVCKVLEHIVCSNIMNHLNRSTQVDNEQTTCLS